MNIKPTMELLEQIIAIYSCDSTIPEILQVTLPAYITASYITNNIEETNKWISLKRFSKLNTCHKPKQPSFESKNKYVLLNCNNEQPDADFKRNVQPVQVEHKQEAPILSILQLSILQLRIEIIKRHVAKKLLVTLTTNLEIKL